MQKSWLGKLGYESFSQRTKYFFVKILTTYLLLIVFLRCKDPTNKKLLLYCSRLCMDHIIREHIAVQYFFDAWVVNFM